MSETRTNKIKSLDGSASDLKAAQAVATPDPKALEAIGRALEAHYADLVQAPLPGRFVELLARLDGGERISGAQEQRDALG
jgi:hypothetical protein